MKNIIKKKTRKLFYLFCESTVIIIINYYQIKSKEIKNTWLINWYVDVFNIKKKSFSSENLWKVKFRQVLNFFQFKIEKLVLVK